MEVKFMFVYAFLAILGGSHSKELSHISTFKHHITVSEDGGHNQTECLYNSSVACKNLDYVLKQLVNTSELRNSTKIEIKGRQILEENHNLTNLTDFALCGEAKYESAEKSEIQCRFGRGLIIEFSKDIAIEHLSFRGCGSRQLIPGFVNISIHSGIFITNTIDVVVNHCNISNSSGIGMTFFDVGGLVIFNHTIFNNNTGNVTSRSNVWSELAQVGGGLIIQLTHDGGLAPFNSSNNIYHFHHCEFLNNDCTWDIGGDKIDPEGISGSRSSFFGCGGGVVMSFQGEAKDNRVLMDSCTFVNNVADWGGGYFFLFQDKSQNNSVHLNHVKLESNLAHFGGGGGRFGFYPCVKFSDLLKLHPNYFKHTYCTYWKNSAGWGGGVSIFGSTEFPENTHKDNSLSFSNCHWVKNQATVGSALGLLSNWLDPKQRATQQPGKGLAYTIKLMNCTFKSNIITPDQEYGKFVVGTGAIYTDIAPIIMQNVSLCHNNGTALVLDWSYVYISGNVMFYNNRGSKGGAIALYGRSKITLGENSSLNFTSNRALLKGGAIFAYSQGPDLKAFDVRILDRSTCFFSYWKAYSPPENWTAKVSFYHNSVPNKPSGNSIYADTLQFCRGYGGLSEALEWKPVFNYYGLDNETKSYQVVTDPVTIQTHNNNWMVFPGEMFYPKIDLRDEKNQSVDGLLKILINSDSVWLGEHVSHYMYVSGGVSAIPLSLAQNVSKTGYYDLTLSSVYTQVISTTLGNITTLGCYGGYKFGKTKCTCLDSNEMPFGYSRCEGDGTTIYLKLGYWAVTDKKGKLDVLSCPRGYCKCANKSTKLNTKDECIFKKFNNENKQCTDNRVGRLCGTCKKGFSVVVGNEDCRECTNMGLLYMIPIVVGLTFIVLAIIYFEIDFFSGPLNSWLYTYHIISLLPATSDNYMYLDPFILFVIGLTNGAFDIKTGKCFWDGMDALQKHTLEYLMPIYCLALLYFINKLLRNFPSLNFSRHSFHHAFVTIVIISYASLLQNTMIILQPITIHGKLYVYVQADVEYFSNKHIQYAIPALLILSLVVIPFPFIIAFNSFFTKHWQRLRHFIPFFEVLQSPYRTDRSWFSSYYIFCRLLFISVMMASPEFQHSRFAIYEAICVIILMTFVLLQPYSEENMFYFKVDTFFLTLLCLIYCFIEAMETNVHQAAVLSFNILIHILTYIPFIYSLGLLVQYVRKSWNSYVLNRRERENTPLLQNCDT